MLCSRLRVCYHFMLTRERTIQIKAKKLNDKPNQSQNDKHFNHDSPQDLNNNSPFDQNPPQHVINNSHLNPNPP